MERAIKFPKMILGVSYEMEFPEGLNMKAPMGF
jgi:hypothetical protein